MENVSKAVVMAGSVLIAVGIISIALYFYGVMRGYFSETEQVYTQTQIDTFNRFYQSYADGSDIRAIDVLNIYNKALDDGIQKSKIVGVDLTKLIPKVYVTDKYSYTLGYDSTGRVDQITFVKK